MSVESNEVSGQNSNFWNEACGTVLAHDIGNIAQDVAGFAKFDEAYFDLYPYLLDYFPAEQIRGKRVLEIGLGYGSTSQKIAESGADYVGLDIANGPVEIVRQRLRLHGLNGEAMLGNALSLPFPDKYFDCVISIGCLHHTGDTQRAVSEVFRVLKPGGKAVVMVYNALCYKNWIIAPLETLRTQLSAMTSGSEKLRLAHDRDTQGRPPPETAFFSIRQLNQVFRDFRVKEFRKENCYLRFPRSWRLIRRFALSTLGRSCGLNIYVTAVK